MRTYGPGNGTYGKGKKTGIAFPCRRNPAGGHEGLSYEKKLKRVYFPLARKREKTPPLHFYCFLLLIFPVHEYLFHPPERLKDEAPRSTRLLQEGRPPEGR